MLKKCLASCVIILSFSANAFSENITINNLEINKIRAVGDYSGNTFDNTIEIWFTTTLNFPEGSVCTYPHRVYVDAKHSHILSAAYMAMASKRQVNINVDTTLPIRGGACEVSFLDIVN